MSRPNALALALTAVLVPHAPSQGPCPLRWDTAFGVPGSSGFLGAQLGITTFAAWDDGNGPALYAGGTFTNIGGISASGIAKWDGTSWSPLGSGLNGPALALLPFDDGSGPALYVAGSFSAAGGVTTTGIARWNGTVWSAVGGGLNYSAAALALHDDGSGPRLHVGGGFTLAGGVAASRVARWDGAAWSALGTGFSLSPGLIPGEFVAALASHTDASGTSLVAGGPVFGSLGGSILRWSGSVWTSVNWTGSSPVASLLSHDDGSGPRIYAGVSTSVPPLPAVYRSTATNWEAVGGGAGSTSSALSGIARSLRLFDDGSGPKLYAANQAPTFTMQVARWDGSGWSAVATPVNGALTLGRLNAIGTFGNDLVLGGLFTSVSGVVSTNIAKGRVNRPLVLLGQIGGPGNGVSVWNQNLVPNRAYQNVFSVEPCPTGPGGGPWLGLCASDPAILFFQIGLPLGAVPFHFTSPNPWTVAGPFNLPPGLVIEGLCFDRTYNVLGCVGPVSRYTVQ